MPGVLASDAAVEQPQAAVPAIPIVVDESDDELVPGPDGSADPFIE